MLIPAATDDSVAIAENSNIANCTNTIDERYHEKKNKEALQFMKKLQLMPRKHGLNGHTDRQTFKRIMPVVTYEDLKPDIDQLIAEGNNISSTLCKSPISHFFRSTGTSSGKSKLIPSTEEQAEKTRHFCSLLMPVLNQQIPGSNKGKAMQLMFHNYTSPIETILCEDTHQSLYSQLLCGLYQNKQVLRLGFTFASGFIGAVKCLQQHWTLLCDDIRHGTIAVDHTKITDPSVRKAVMKILVKPNPELGDFIENECKRDSSWEGIVSRLWPNAKCIVTIITGTMSHHIDDIDFYSNSLPIVSPKYACSECLLGINLNPLTKPHEVSYTLIPTMAYFEFLPILDEDDNQNDNCNQEKEQHHQELVDLVEVELGREYELVITNYAGLYRFRVGDVLRVAGFKNNAPQFNFMRRRNVVLSIDMDKTNENELQKAVKKAVDHLMIMSNVSLVEYTSFSDTSTCPGHYVLYWELQHNNNNAVIPQTVLEECCLVMEEFLGYEYRYMRTTKKLIGPLEIKIVETGTFRKLMDHAINQGSSFAQYKTPRCMKLGAMFQLLNSMVLSSYFSPRCPQL
ncbi:hypothetical protein MKW98_026967 [Papaver atlanticum]|uniref:Uncharacterized protein n=1 Tax=Papaver atlanticum TaxID=357466 RepID=A0AAD4SVJ3_9MAGN|nr:hypothetical protein MKW98_026967 [Papaver atlanticum]